MKNRGFPGGLIVKNLLPMQRTQVRSLVHKDPTCHKVIKLELHGY